MPPVDIFIEAQKRTLHFENSAIFEKDATTGSLKRLNQNPLALCHHAAKALRLQETKATKALALCEKTFDEVKQELETVEKEEDGMEEKYEEEKKVLVRKFLKLYKAKDEMRKPQICKGIDNKARKNQTVNVDSIPTTLDSDTISKLPPGLRKLAKYSQLRWQDLKLQSKNSTADSEISSSLDPFQQIENGLRSGKIQRRGLGSRMGFKAKQSSQAVTKQSQPNQSSDQLSNDITALLSEIDDQKQKEQTDLEARWEAMDKISVANTQNLNNTSTMEQTQSGFLGVDGNAIHAKRHMQTKTQSQPFEFDDFPTTGSKSKKASNSSAELSPNRVVRGTIPKNINFFDLDGAFGTNMNTFDSTVTHTNIGNTNEVQLNNAGSSYYNPTTAIPRTLRPDPAYSDSHSEKNDNDVDDEEDESDDDDENGPNGNNIIEYFSQQPLNLGLSLPSASGMNLNNGTNANQNQSHKGPWAEEDDFFFNNEEPDFI